MEKKGTSMFQFSQDQGWNIVELEARRQLRRTVNALIDLVDNSSLTTSEIKRQLQEQHEGFGRRFAIQLVRALQRDDASERQAIVWLLTLLDDKETILPLQQLSQNEHLSRSVRLSASFALAGLGATPEVQEAQSRRTHARLYAIS
jgi:HEAT repeat protein